MKIKKSMKHYLETCLAYKTEDKDTNNDIIN